MTATFRGFCDESGVFTLDYPEQFRRFVAAKFKGEEIELEVRKRRTKRSDKQNRLLWALLTPWAHFLGYEPVELKDELLGLLWGYEEHISKLTGEVVRVPNKARSSRLTTAEFTELIDFMAIKAAETGYVMELPSESPRRAKDARREAA